jgi:staphylococcal nuclease domain-containing protein 1
MSSTGTTTAPSTTPAGPPLIFPKQGTARIKSVLSGDTVVLLGKPLAPNLSIPEAIFTFEGLSAPRYACPTTTNKNK